MIRAIADHFRRLLLASTRYAARELVRIFMLIPSYYPFSGQMNSSLKLACMRGCGSATTEFTIYPRPVVRETININKAYLPFKKALNAVRRAKIEFGEVK